jgi:hypothetical protein
VLLLLTVQVTQHPSCTLRVTIVPRSDENPGGAQPAGAGDKFQLSALMVAHIEITLSHEMHSAMQSLR